MEKVKELFEEYADCEITIWNKDNQGNLTSKKGELTEMSYSSFVKALNDNVKFKVEPYSPEMESHILTMCLRVLTPQQRKRLSKNILDRNTLKCECAMPKPKDPFCEVNKHICTDYGDIID